MTLDESREGSGCERRGPLDLPGVLEDEPSRR